MILINFIDLELKIVRFSTIFVAVWFCVFSIPAFYLVREKKSEKLTKKHIKKSFSAIFNTFNDIKKYKKIVRFLVARLFYNDALITIFALGGAYAIETLDFTLTETLILGIVLNPAFMIRFTLPSDKPSTFNEVKNADVRASMAVRIELPNCHGCLETCL